MKNGQVKHSEKLTEEDLEPERLMAETLSRFGGTINPPPLSKFKSRPGFYILFAPRPRNGGSLKGPFDSENEAKEAHREWMWESKH
jgi:hypothetical protein